MHCPGIVTSESVGGNVTSMINLCCDTPGYDLFRIPISIQDIQYGYDFV